MSQPYIGSIYLFAGNFAPRGYALCQGQLLSISANSALFSILGTTYGGDGVSTFALPDLRGRVPVQQGPGPGLPVVNLGEVSGSAQVALTIANLPTHTHQLGCDNTGVVSGDPTNNYPGSTGLGGTQLYGGGPPNATMGAKAILPTGDGVPLSTMPPFLGLNFIIALVGIFPSRN